MDFLPLNMLFFKHYSLV